MVYTASIGTTKVDSKKLARPLTKAEVERIEEDLDFQRRFLHDMRTNGEKRAQREVELAENKIKTSAPGSLAHKKATESLPIRLEYLRNFPQELAKTGKRYMTLRDRLEKDDELKQERAAKAMANAPAKQAAAPMARMTSTTPMPLGPRAGPNMRKEVPQDKRGVVDTRRLMQAKAPRPKPETINASNSKNAAGDVARPQKKTAEKPVPKQGAAGRKRKVAPPVNDFSADEDEAPTKKPRRAGSTAASNNSPAFSKPKRQHDAIDESDSEPQSPRKKVPKGSEFSTDDKESSSKKTITASTAAPKSMEEASSEEKAYDLLKSSTSSLNSTNTGATTPAQPDCNKAEKIVTVKIDGKFVRRILTKEGTIKGINATNKPDRFEKDTPARDPKSEDYQLRGLLNVQQACFGNAALQVLNASLTFEEIKKLRGTEPLDLFQYTYPNVQNFFNDKLELKPGGKKELETLRINIVKKRGMSAEDKIPVAPYLGQVLLDMREGVTHKSKKYEEVNPLFLQQAFAYGGPESRLKYDGDTQGDSHEYLTDLVNAVAEEHPFVAKIFQTETTVHEKCKECQWTNNSTDVQFGRTIQVPTKSESIALRSLLEGDIASAETASDKKCPGCDKQDALVKTTSLADAPGHLLVELNRASSNGKKIMTKIALGDDDLKFDHGDNSYVAKAIVRHSGRTTSRGHYTSIVEHQSKWWKLDDLECEPATEADIADGRTNLCSSVLLQKVKKDEAKAEKSKEESTAKGGQQMEGQEGKEPRAEDGESKAKDAVTRVTA